MSGCWTDPVWIQALKLVTKHRFRSTQSTIRPLAIQRPHSFAEFTRFTGLPERIRKVDSTHCRSESWRLCIQSAVNKVDTEWSQIHRLLGAYGAWTRLLDALGRPAQEQFEQTVGGRNGTLAEHTADRSGQICSPGISVGAWWHGGFAKVSTRSFNLEPLTALHLDHIVNSPEPQSKGCLGCLVRAWNSMSLEVNWKNLKDVLEVWRYTPSRIGTAGCYEQAGQCFLLPDTDCKYGIWDIHSQSKRIEKSQCQCRCNSHVCIIQSWSCPSNNSSKTSAPLATTKNDRTMLNGSRTINDNILMWQSTVQQCPNFIFFK